MTELQFYKFIHDNNIEHRWERFYDGREDVIIWVPFYHLKELANMIDGFLDEGGCDVRFQPDCIAIEVRDMVEYFGIEIENVFPKNDG